jgi:hypothetical protein
MRFAVLALGITLLSSCSAVQAPTDDLAVAKIPASQLQTMLFVALNDDKPGTPVNVVKYLVPGRFTIIYYYSIYSDPTQDFHQALAQLVQRRHDLAVRTVNINRPEAQGIDWDSPVVHETRLNSLPYFFIFDPRQSLRAHGRPAYTQIVQWINANR